MASYQYVYTIKNLSKSYPGGKTIIKETTLSFLKGAKIGIIGRNGAGKSTLMKIIAGIDKDFNGEAFPAHGITVGYLPQEPQLDPNLTVYENIMLALSDKKKILDDFESISEKLSQDITEDEMTSLIEEQGKLMERIDALNLWDLKRQVEIAMDALCCPNGDSSVTTLSGGEKRRVALCKLLMQQPDLLLLDEPTNHLDAESIAWLDQHLQNYPGAIILVTHDRYFLDHVVGWILELEYGNAYPFEGNYSKWLEYKQKRLELQEKQDTDRKKFLKEELEWVRMSHKARQAKSKARLASYEQMLKEDSEKENYYDTSRIYIPPGPRLGDVVIEANNLEKGYNDKLLFENLSFKLPPNGIVGVIGVNGAGKTTLFKLLTGIEKPDSGTLKIGETVKMAYVNQSRDALDPNKTVWEEISEGRDIIELGKRSTPSRAYVANFGFKGPDQQKRVAQLSGGERNRVHLAKLLKTGANLILLDEPTNDLDVDTLRSLEEALQNFVGCAVVISHDRWFLDKIATHILAFEGNSKVTWFEGDYTFYEEDLKRRLGVTTIEPHKIRYKPLKR